MTPAPYRSRRALVAAWQVRPEDRHAIAKWVGGQPWAAGVVVPTPNGGEAMAEHGDWIVKRPLGVGHAVHVVSAAEFALAYEPAEPHAYRVVEKPW